MTTGELWYQLRVSADELRKVRESSPATIGAAMTAYTTALANARSRGVEPALLLLVGELVWLSIRPESEPTPDSIGEALDVWWRKHLANLGECAPPPKESTGNG